VTTVVCLVAFTLMSPVHALMARTESGMISSANPMRRVISMLQMMTSKVEEEGKKEAELFEKFMCYCKSGKATLGKSIADAEEKIPQLESDIKEAKGMKAQLDGDLGTHKADREAAKEEIAKATSMREKDAAAFAKESGEDKSNLDSLTKALAAIEKGMAGAFLQTNAAAVLRKLSLSQDMSNADRDLMASFLMGESSHGYSPASGEIVGILKQMKDTMEKDLADVLDSEETAKRDFEGLVAAKEKEIASATKAIEEKTKRTGETAVSIVNLEEDLDDTINSLAEDKKLLADLEKNCAAKEKEYAEICKMRQEELIAIADTIKILNDDDAQELFKKTIPSASASLIQLQVTSTELRSQALRTLTSIRRRGAAHDVNIDLITMALHGKKVSFDKVIGMINDMVELLGKEQVADDNKKTYCEGELDKADDKKKELELSIDDKEKAIDELKDTMKTIDEEIKTIEDGIVELDRDVAAGTEQRKKEHEEFEVTKAESSAAIGLIEMAKNRMQKFYNPKLYKPPPETTPPPEFFVQKSPQRGFLAEEDDSGISFVQLQKRAADDSAFPPPPTALSMFQKKGEEANGVLAMMDMMKADVEKELQEAEFAEKDAQSEYETMVTDAAGKRAADKKTIEQKLSQKAEVDAELVKTEDAKKVEMSELQATLEYIGEVHSDCDWLLENFDTRKEARANEIDALKKAVAVLSGADYSLVQLSHKVVVQHA